MSFFGGEGGVFPIKIMSSRQKPPRCEERQQRRCWGEDNMQQRSGNGFKSVSFMSAQGLLPLGPSRPTNDLPSVTVHRELFVSSQPSRLRNVSHFLDNQPHRAGTWHTTGSSGCAVATGLTDCWAISVLLWTLEALYQVACDHRRAQRRRIWKWFIIPAEQETQ